MISYLIRRALGPGVGGFWVGLVMMVVGIVLTVFSAAVSAALGAQVTVVFYGLIVLGLVRMAASLPALLANRTHEHTYVSAGPMMPTYYSPPTHTPSGVCWQCGGRMRRDTLICMHCGATRAATNDSEPEPTEDYRSSDGPAMPPDGPRPVTYGPRPVTYGPRQPANPRGGYVPNRAATYGPQQRYGPPGPQLDQPRPQRPRR